ncbi:MAG: crotonase/enoyl-CoA hydratase family protein [Polyangiaceae bacterium]
MTDAKPAEAETIRVEREGAIAHVVLQETTMRPQFFRELGATFRTLARDTELRAVVLRSAVKCFSYGLDLPAAASEMGEAFAGGGALTRMKLLSLIEELQSEIDAVENCPVPTVVALHGWCIGGGLDLAAACDIRLASADTKLSLRETKIAIVADLGSLQRLPAIIGDGLTRELAFTGKDIDATRALQIGLVNAVHDDAAAVQHAALTMAQEIAANAPLTVRGVKKVLDFGRSRRRQDGLDYVALFNSAFLASEDLGEAMAAFMEKRAPQFKGR